MHLAFGWGKDIMILFVGCWLAKVCAVLIEAQIHIWTLNIDIELEYFFVFRILHLLLVYFSINAIAIVFVITIIIYSTQ